MKPEETPVSFTVFVWLIVGWAAILLTDFALEIIRAWRSKE
jgi:hypothetical protein